MSQIEHWANMKVIFKVKSGISSSWENSNTLFYHALALRLSRAKAGYGPKQSPRYPVNKPFERIAIANARAGNISRNLRVHVSLIRLRHYCMS